MKKNKKEEFKGYQLVYQNNRLIESKYNLTLQEKKLVLFSISKIKTDDFGVKPILFSCRELSEMCSLEGESLYSELKKTTAKLMSRVFVVRNLDDNKYTQLNWVSRSTYHEKEGIVEIQFNKDLSQFLLDLKKNFTTIPLSQTLGLSSFHAVRMFELLKQYENIGEREFELGELKEILGIHKDKLKLFADFKRKVLEISQRELGLKTDIYFTFEEIKTSRRVTGLIFKIYKNDPQKNLIKKKRKAVVEKAIKELNNDYEKKELLDLGFSLPTIRKFFVQFSPQQINKAIQVTLEQVEKGKVKNPKALFQSALKNHWSL